MKCKELQICDWIQDKNGFQWQITNVGDDYAYATFEGNEGDPWEFDDKDDQPEGIPQCGDSWRQEGGGPAHLQVGGVPGTLPQAGRAER